MAFSIDTKVKDLRKSEAASDIIAQYSPGFKTDPQMKLVGALTFRKLCSFPQAGLNRSTLIERLARIKRELNCDLEDPEQRLLLQILLKAQQIHGEIGQKA